MNNNLATVALITNHDKNEYKGMKMMIMIMLIFLLFVFLQS